MMTRRLLAVAALAALAACQAKPRTTEVTPATFASAIAGYSCGDTLKLAPGAYNNPRWSTKDCPGWDGVTILSADPLDRARFVGGLLMDNARSVTFQDVDIEQTATTASYGHVWRAYAGREIIFRGVHFTGTVAPDGVSKWGYGINVGGITGLIIERCRFRDTYMAINNGTVTDLTIRDNDIQNFGVDGIHLGGIVNGLVEGNYIGAAAPTPGAHPDGIQLTHGGDVRGSENLVFRDNLVEVPFEGPNTQGIFGRSENGNASGSIRVEDNLVLNAPYNALAFGDVKAMSATGNRVMYEEHPGTNWTAWMRFSNSAGVVKGNVTQGLIVEASPNLEVSGNTQTGFATRDEIDAARAHWMAQHPGIDGGGSCKACEAEKAELQRRIDEAVAILQGQEPVRARHR
jgi:hypothetical protein